MGYADSLLASGESILLRTRQHWFVLAWSARWAIVAILVAVALLILRAVSNSSGVFMDLLGYVTLALFVVGLALILWGWLRYLNEEYMVTTRRVIHTEGVINKKTTDSSLEKINDAILSESIFGRIFGFGDLEILTASEAGIEKLRMLRDAKSFKKAMLDAKHELEIDLTRPTMPPLRTPAEPAAAAEQAPEPPAPVAAAPATPAAPPPAALSSDQVTDALGRLGDLRDRGIITPEEFEAKKAELLGRL
jgi:uncharacterized membrane protein YdbT with pleckstrin-like domain